MALDFTDYLTVRRLLKDAQDVEWDNRTRVREVKHFVDKRDGQWEPSIIQRMSGRPRYTFDKMNPIIDDIAGEMDQADFAIRVRPAGGDATKELAENIGGLIRNIENISNAPDIYSSAGREMTTAGLAGWEIVQDWASTDSFDQDLFIKPLLNYEDRVWFDTGAEMQDMSDARYVFVFDNLTQDEYTERFPDGSRKGLEPNKTFQAYQQVPDFITVSRFIYKEPVKKTLVLMSNGAVYQRTPEFESVINELQAQGITIERERERESFKIKSRILDAGDWLIEPEDTVFTLLPVIPVFGNFKITEKKVIYRGAIDKLLDAQRSYNYARSRETEEIALAPRPKLFMTRHQAGNENDRRKLQTLNTNADPVQFFTPDPELPGVPAFVGPAPVNAGLIGVVQNSINDIQSSAAVSEVQQGDTDGPLSGVAIQKLQNKGDNRSFKYFKSMRIAICATAKVIMDAIPRVYDTRRQVRILHEDDTDEMVSFNEMIFDQESRQFKMINDLSKGHYDVTCDIGPAFKNRQQETVQALQELSQVIPGLAEITADIQLKNIPSPGVDLAAERVRRKLLEAGNIPESQLTDEEKQEIQAAQLEAAQNPPEPDPIQQALLAEQEANIIDTQSRAQERQDKTQLKVAELELKQQEQALKAQESQGKRDMEEMKLALQQQSQQVQQQMQLSKQIIDNLNTQAQTLKLLREAQGIDTFTGPNAQEAFIQQAETITEQQDRVQPTPETDRITGP